MVGREGSAGVSREYGGRSKKSNKKLNKKSSKSTINIIFKNNTVIRILVD
jgi:hypothetical protein